MIGKTFQWSWRKMAVVTVACALAAVLGAFSEVVAQQAEVINVKGEALEATWLIREGTKRGRATARASETYETGNVTNGRQASVWAVASGRQIDWSQGQAVQFSASGEVDRNDLSVPSALVTGELDTELEGRKSTWNVPPGSGWNWRAPATVSVRVDLASDGTKRQHIDIDRFSNWEGDRVVVWRENGFFSEASGTGEILLDGEPFIPAGTETTWAELHSNNSGRIEVQQ